MIKLPVVSAVRSSGGITFAIVIHHRIE
jgi:hypothetical protein